MGNLILKKEPVNHKQSTKSNDSSGGGGAVLSNIPGVQAPPKFNVKKRDENTATANGNLKKPVNAPEMNNNNNNKNKNRFLSPNNARQTGIDSLPRHTAGSAKLVESIRNSKEHAAHNDDNGDNDSLLNVNHRRMKQVRPISEKNTEVQQGKGGSSSTVSGENRTSQEGLSQLLTELSKKEKPAQMKPKSGAVAQDAKLNKKKFIPDSDDLNHIPSVSDNDERFGTFQSTRSRPSRHHRSTPSISNGSPVRLRVDGSADKTNRNYKNLHRKRDKMVSNLLSLNKIENEQRLKILEQERQLRIQNMKLDDALLVQDSLTNFNDLYAAANSDYERHHDMAASVAADNSSERYRYVKHRHAARPAVRSNTSAIPTMRQRVPMRFPTIVTKYEPQNYAPSPSPIPPRTPSESLGRYRPRKASIDKVDLYLETSEDIVDSNGRILSSNQRVKYIGEADSSKAAASLIDQPQVLYKNEIPIGNHKYEIVPPVSDGNKLTQEELDEILKIIEETERQTAPPRSSSSSYYLNGNLIKRTGDSQAVAATAPPTIPTRRYRTVSPLAPMRHSEIPKPSFTIPEKIYKTYLNKKQASNLKASQSLRIPRETGNSGSQLYATTLSSSSSSPFKKVTPRRAPLSDIQFSQHDKDVFVTGGATKLNIPQGANSAAYRRCEDVKRGIWDIINKSDYNSGEMTQAQLNEYLYCNMTKL